MLYDFVLIIVLCISSHRRSRSRSYSGSPDRSRSPPPRKRQSRSKSRSYTRSPERSVHHYDTSTTYLLDLVPIHALLQGLVLILVLVLHLIRLHQLLPVLIKHELLSLIT